MESTDSKTIVTDSGTQVKVSIGDVAHNEDCDTPL